MKAKPNDSPTEPFRKSVLYDSHSQRTLSPGSKEPQHDRAVSAWTVRWVLSVRPGATDKSVRVDVKCDIAVKTSEGRTFVLYRRQMLKLLRFPKPTFDQLVIELPMLMGFRAGEIGTWRAEHVDFVNGDTLVLDSKKHRLFKVPLNVQVAKHAEDVLAGREEGYVLRNRSNRWRGRKEPLSRTAAWYIWDKWTRLARLPNALEISPNVGRRFFAAEWYYKQGLSLVTLQRILRHSHFETTLRYVHSLIFYEDVRRDYDRFQQGLGQEVALKNAA